MSGDAWQCYRYGGGDPAPAFQTKYGLESAANRLLWGYIKNTRLYCCPADRGFDGLPGVQPFNNTYQTIGTSYRYNAYPWSPNVPSTLGIAGRREDWIRFPARYILVHESPASPYPVNLSPPNTWLYCFWHYALGPATVKNLGQVRDRSISPVFFADGHAANIDFTLEIRTSPDPTDPWPNWYWYEPAR
jgi:hypothetical protein